MQCQWMTAMWALPAQGDDGSAFDSRPLEVCVIVASLVQSCQTVDRVMTTIKTESVTFRILPEVKASLREAAAREHRSLSNMLEVMIRDWCRRERVNDGHRPETSPHGPAG